MTYQVLVFQLCVNFSLVLIAKRLLLQIGAKKGAVETRMLHFWYIKFRIFMSFRKPCRMPLRKLIPPFTLTACK